MPVAGLFSKAEKTKEISNRRRFSSFGKWCWSNTNNFTRWIELTWAQETKEKIPRLGWGLCFSRFFFEKIRSNVCKKHWLTKDCSGGLGERRRGAKRGSCRVESGLDQMRGGEIGGFVPDELPEFYPSLVWDLRWWRAAASAPRRRAPNPLQKSKKFTTKPYFIWIRE